MDLARTTELSIDEAMSAFDTIHWESPTQHPGDVAHQFYTKLAWTIEETLQEQAGYEIPEDRLLHFRYGLSEAEPPTGPLDRRWDMSVVKVAVRGTPNANDLLSCLSLELSPIGDNPSRQQVIFEPSDVVAFQLLRDTVVPGGLRNERRTFSFPTSVYLDQFLQENSKLANDKRNLQRELYAKVDQLKERKGQLRWHEGRDVMRDLRSSIHYYENIADHNDEEARKIHIQDMATKLHDVLIQIEKETQAIDAEIKKQEDAAANVYDGTELRNYRYDLRVVLVHDGLYGRSHVYSYVKQNDKWWKVVDYSVTEVPESTVLTDATGLHLNAGPFFLIYSRAISEEEEAARPNWPENVKNSVKHNNKSFFMSLPPEVAMTVEDPNSPPTSPMDQPMDLLAEQAVTEPMDLSN
ncbi:hypothetical protein QCA50_013465 [Cerrena zonata]|uniref:ubiquitinyl hydrolase 1 n=1 Tax=Cerrena zonata TaxID=2478898 RepID=A0AAW0FWB9_9APHY